MLMGWSWAQGGEERKSETGEAETAQEQEVEEPAKTHVTFFPFDTNGASIDPYNAYIEVNGMLEAWDWGLPSKTYAYHVNPYGVPRISYGPGMAATISLTPTWPIFHSPR